MKDLARAFAIITTMLAVKGMVGSFKEKQQAESERRFRQEVLTRLDRIERRAAALRK